MRTHGRSFGIMAALALAGSSVARAEDIDLLDAEDISKATLKRKAKQANAVQPTPPHMEHTPTRQQRRQAERKAAKARAAQ